MSLKSLKQAKNVVLFLSSRRNIKDPKYQKKPQKLYNRKSEKKKKKTYNHKQPANLSVPR